MARQRITVYDEQVTATSSTYRGIIEGYKPLYYPRKPSAHAWIRASFIRFLNGLAGMKEGELRVA